ncbi:hypothetical protein G5714_024680 [Onychostoma macrolepis]|uniref:Uncharacterized protein n=1 Tax=Onychostoma macrolepis TaxID=369639 RepID=A0A7J6BHM5_9TELE|nr:hypothetical protein G5714_024680 [Onychostoma macrolepis]
MMRKGSLPIDRASGSRGWSSEGLLTSSALLSADRPVRFPPGLLWPLPLPLLPTGGEGGACLRLEDRRSSSAAAGGSEPSAARATGPPTRPWADAALVGGLLRLSRPSGAGGRRRHARRFCEDRGLDLNLAPTGGRCFGGRAPPPLSPLWGGRAAATRPPVLRGPGSRPQSRADGRTPLLVGGRVCGGFPTAARRPGGDRLDSGQPPAPLGREGGACLRLEDRRSSSAAAGGSEPSAARATGPPTRLWADAALVGGLLRLSPLWGGRAAATRPPVLRGPGSRPQLAPTGGRCFGGRAPPPLAPLGREGGGDTPAVLRGPGSRPQLAPTGGRCFGGRAPPPLAPLGREGGGDIARRFCEDRGLDLNFAPTGGRCFGGRAPPPLAPLGREGGACLRLEDRRSSSAAGGSEPSAARDGTSNSSVGGRCFGGRAPPPLAPLGREGGGDTPAVLRGPGSRPQLAPTGGRCFGGRAPPPLSPLWGGRAAATRPPVLRGPGSRPQLAPTGGRCFGGRAPPPLAPLGIAERRHDPPSTTSGQARQPAEFKHITKRRKRN